MADQLSDFHSFLQFLSFMDGESPMLYTCIGPGEIETNMHDTPIQGFFIPIFSD